AGPQGIQGVAGAKGDKGDIGPQGTAADESNIVHINGTETLGAGVKTFSDKIIVRNQADFVAGAKLLTDRIEPSSLFGSIGIYKAVLTNSTVPTPEAASNNKEIPNTEWTNNKIAETITNMFESGTWGPQITPQQYVNRISIDQASYTRIGKIVNVTGQFSFLNTAQGNLDFSLEIPPITGIPFNNLTTGVAVLNTYTSRTTGQEVVGQAARIDVDYNSNRPHFRLDNFGGTLSDVRITYQFTVILR
ncbi:hypothetical protein, partial [Pedobacter jeongneungensis]|uniref:hypothetical protein n=1 Tax=Pedobacter jeongneungensis TaxID=947309 RepID=UPI000566AA78